LLIEPVFGLLQFLALALEFLTHDDFSQEHFQQAVLLTFQAGQGLTDVFLLCLHRLRQPCSGLGTCQFLGDQIRVGQDGAQVLPDQIV
jgi:hypothetical protein